MDSLSQIVLGAAVGEAVLGKRLGNRAMVWGAVAGTLPDMDVLGQYFLNELDNLAFHRGISHSILASVLGAVVFGWATHRLYRSPHHRYVAMMAKAAAAVVVGFVVNFLTQIFSPGGWLPVALYIPLAAWLWWRHGQRRYFSGHWVQPDADLKGWVLLFFWGFLTHIVLDCFTTYGTQVFAPFSDQRVAWGTISVADPLYTAPFLTCLLVASTCPKHDRRRAMWNGVGLGISSLYLALTAVNHTRVTRVMEEALAEQGVVHSSCFITPTIFNNVLWNAVVDREDDFLVAQYSLFDEIPVSFHPVLKGHELHARAVGRRALGADGLEHGVIEAHAILHAGRVVPCEGGHPPEGALRAGYGLVDEQHLLKKDRTGGLSRGTAVAAVGPFSFDRGRAPSPSGGR